MISSKDEFKACHPKVALILKRMKQKRPRSFEGAFHRLGLSVDRINTASPASGSLDEDREKKKRAALDRQAKVMAQFQAQQKSFMENQGDIDWGDMDDLEDEEAPPAEEHKKSWKYPSGTCILCQEDTDDRRLYGTFAFFVESQILRQTDFQDPDFVREAFNTPEDLDRSAEDIRPFGVAHENRKIVQKVNKDHEVFEEERSTIGKGWPPNLCRKGPVAVGCGHIMHYSCFEAYFEATIRRHNQQIARHPPEDTSRLEFVCPLCKALGNAFLPIIWKGREESYPGPLMPSTPFGEFLDKQMHSAYYTLGAARPPDQVQSAFASYTANMMVNTLAERSSQLLDEAWVDVGGRSISTGTPFSDTFSVISAQDAASRGSTPDANNAMRELVSVYRRLRMTLQKNDIYTQHTMNADAPDNNELCLGEVLAAAVGCSISAVEIQQRGVEADYGLTFLEKIPDQSLTQLRILSETVTSFIAVGGLREAGENKVEAEYRESSERQHCQLFMEQYLGEETELTKSPEIEYPPILSLEDIFVFLCECVFGVTTAQNFDIANMVRLCYLAEITKVVYHLGHNMPAPQWLKQVVNISTSMDPALANFAMFCQNLSQIDLQCAAKAGSTRAVSTGANKAFNQPGLDTLEGWYQFVRKYALAFLRKCVILLHVKFGVDFNSHISPQPEQKELERLTEALRLPSFDEMLAALTMHGEHCGWPRSTVQLVTGWVNHQTVWTVSKEAHPPVDYEGSALPKPPPPSAVLSHPGIFELVGLPKNYDALIEECTRRKCPTKGKEMTDPTICLLCGNLFCSQAVCCTQEVKEGRNKIIRYGGAQQHMRKCHGTVGIFINIRKCCVFYVHRTSGSFSNAPYIDKYGESDMGFRHGRQLFLHQKRYDSMLRNLWLSHGVPSLISRRLEADINNGGWETI